jgi:hypothetical protein
MDVSGLQFLIRRSFHRLMVVEVAVFTRLEDYRQCGIHSSAGQLAEPNSPKSRVASSAASTRPIARSPTLLYAPTASARLIISKARIPVPTTPPTSFPQFMHQQSLDYGDYAPPAVLYGLSNVNLDQDGVAAALRGALTSLRAAGAAFSNHHFSLIVSSGSLESDYSHYLRTAGFFCSRSNALRLDLRLWSTFLPRGNMSDGYDA